jgi:uncharacterized protein (TIGR03083 family)
MASPELSALYSVLDRVVPRAPTACTEWTAHDVLAHLAAGAKERADLIEETLAGLPERGTKPFAEREGRFRSLPDAELRAAVVQETGRFEAAAAKLARRGDDATIPFTGRRFTAAKLTTHQRSEAAIHRWDLVGDDEVGDALLAQPELTRHGVAVLNDLEAVLREAPAARVRLAGASGLGIVLRSPGQPDIVLEGAGDQGRFTIAGQTANGDAIVTTDAAQRLLLIWGRHPTGRPIGIDTKMTAQHAVESVLWPASRPWPDRTSVPGGTARHR